MDEYGARVMASVASCYAGMDVLLMRDGMVCLCSDFRAGRLEWKGKSRGWRYDGSDGSLRPVSHNPKMFYFILGKAMPLSQEEMLDRGDFTEKDYEEYAGLLEGALKPFEEIRVREVTFKGEPFRYSAKGACTQRKTKLKKRRKPENEKN